METDDAGWTTQVVVATVVGLSAVVLLWLCDTSRQHIHLPVREIGVEPGKLYTFLSDPQNLNIIHPKTTAIVVDNVTEGEGGRRRTQFVWEEKVPFTVKSVATLTCDPSTRTVVIDITPAGNMFKVKLTWRCRRDSRDEATSNYSDSANIKEGHRSTESPRNGGDRPTDDMADDTKNITKDDHHTFIGDNNTSSVTSDQTTSGQGTSSTAVFENHVLVTGPRCIVVPIAHFTLKTVQEKLTYKLQQYFAEGMR
ncbi:uncharacterized protein [Littorina saxatilis]|uniref:Uncharacterized protein n=1 Tax=Littorina saxatilis TaxID=31220 RepID=A0AAN9C1S5_9CAEN